MLTDPDALASIEEELGALEAEIGRRREAERGRQDELAAKVAGWEKGGINVQRLKDAAAGDLQSYEKAVEDFERNLDDYRLSMEKLMKFESEFIKPSEPVAEKVEAGAAEAEAESELGQAEREGIEEAEKAVAAQVAKIRKVVPRRRSTEDRIRLEQRLRSEHRHQMRRLAERKAARRRNRILVAACVVIAVALAVLYLYKPAGESGGLVIDGKFSDWQDISKKNYPQNHSLPENIDIRQTAVTTQDGAVFCFVKTQGTMMKGFQNGTSGLYEPDMLYIYFDTGGTQNTSYPVDGIWANYMITISGWDNIAQGGDYLHYDGARHIWIRDRSDVQVKASGTQLEARIDPKVFGLARLPAGGVVFDLRDTDGNTDVVS
jgi:anti-sigma-K factor RskA